MLTQPGNWFIIRKKVSTPASVVSFATSPKKIINIVILSNMEDAVWKPLWTIHEMIRK